MTQISPFALPFFISSIISSIDHGPQAHHTIFGMVTDEMGNNVNGADVFIESAMDRRHIISCNDGSFFSDICVNGYCDQVFIKALFGLKLGFERINAHGSHISVDIVVRDIKK